MGYRFSDTGGARESAVRSPFSRRALLLALLLVPLLLLAACSGGARQAVNQPPPADDPVTQPAGELSGVGPSGVATGNTLQGVLWSDSDGDGVFGLGDSVLPEASVVLELEGGETITVSTDRVGQYRITGLEPGTPFTLSHRLALAAVPLSAQAAKRSSAPAEQNVKHYVWQ